MPKVSILIDAKDNASPQLRKVSNSLKEGADSGKKYDKSLEKAEKSQDKLGKSAGKVSGLVKGLLPAIGVAGGLTAMFTIGKNALDAWKVQEAAIANVEAGLKSTGHQAGLTSKQLQDMASGLQSTGIFGDEDILQNLTSQLLTFGNIGAENFDRVQAAALDITAKLKGVNASSGDVMSTAIMMGKAMDDPIRGMNAMRRVGISFSAEQENMVKKMMASNDILGAQQVLLEAVEKQYGGTNEALAETTAGMERAAKNKLGDSMERLGRTLVPVKVGLMKVTAGLADLISTTFESEDEEWSRKMDMMVVKAEQIARWEADGTQQSKQKADMAKTWLGTMEKSVGIQRDVNRSTKERLDLYKGILKNVEDMNKQEVLYSGTSTLETMRRRRAGITDAPKTSGKRELTDQDKKWLEMVKASNSYYDNLMEKSLDARRTEEQRIDAIKERELKALDEVSIALNKEQIKRAKDTIDADAKSAHEKLKIKRTAEMYKEIANIQTAFFTESSFVEVQAIGEMSQMVVESWQNVASDMGKIFEDIAKDAHRTGITVGDGFKIGASMATAALSSLSAILTMQNSMVQAGYNRQLEALRELHEEESKLLDESYEKLKENQESKDELRLLELEMYAEALKGKTDAEIEYALAKKRMDLTQADEEKELAKKKAEEQKKIDQDYAMAKYKIEVESFKTQQKYEKSMIKVQTAIGIVNAWSSAMRLPWPLNVAIGGSLTTLMLGTAKKQTSMIDAQQPPSPPKFAEGVTNFEGGWAIVGERGPEMVTLPRGSNVITNENTEKILGGREPVYVINEIYLDSALVAKNMVEARRSASYGGY